VIRASPVSLVFPMDDGYLLSISIPGQTPNPELPVIGFNSDIHVIHKRFGMLGMGGEKIVINVSMLFFAD
jgi:hypothetical protein